MRNPEAWINKQIPSDMLVGRFWWNYGLCDNCRRFFHSDDLHALLYPQCAEDWTLQRVVGVEEAHGFCPDCLAEIEAEADEIDPKWRKRHRLAA